MNSTCHTNSRRRMLLVGSLVCFALIRGSAQIQYYNTDLFRSAVSAWGRNSESQTNVPTGLTNVAAIAAGGYHSLALLDEFGSGGTIVGWGNNGAGQATAPPGISDFVAVAAAQGGNHSLALRSDGTVVAWGDNSEGQALGQNLLPNGGFELGLTAGPETFARLATYGAWTETANDTALLGMPYAGLPVYQGVEAMHIGDSFTQGAVSQTLVTKIGAVYQVSLAVIGWSGAGGTVRATANNSTVGDFIAPGSGIWGTNAYTFTATTASTTLKIQNITGACTIDDVKVTPVLNNVMAIAAGTFHSLALKADGTVVAWGRNTDGQTNVPPGLSNVAAIAAGGYHGLALRSNGTVVAWGSNLYGQTNVPPGLSNVVAVAGGGNHSLALRGNGTVVGWGLNLYGETSVPAGLSNVTAIAAGFYHNLAVLSNRNVAAWGRNNFGQTNVPTGLSNVVAVAGGGFHSLALRTCLRNLPFSISQSVQPDGILMTFCANVQGDAPISLEWTQWNEAWEVTAIPSSNGCATVFASSTILTSSTNEFLPYIGLTASNACGTIFIGAYVPACAICLSRGSPRVLLGTSGSGTAPTNSSACGNVSTNARWFRLVATNETGLVTVSTEGVANYDTLIAVYTGPLSSPNSLTRIACNNDVSATTKQSRVSFMADVWNGRDGPTYWIVVDPRTNNAPALRVAAGFEPAIASFGLITNPVRAFELKSTIAPAIPYRLQAATNPGAGATWSTLLTTNLTTNYPYVHYRDTGVTNVPRRFYRLAPTP